jgi:hypothetical protein
MANGEWRMDSAPSASPLAIRSSPFAPSRTAIRTVTLYNERAMSSFMISFVPP